MMRNFWWGDSVDKKKFHINGLNYVNPLRKGRLVLEKSKENNMALLAKTAWRCITNENLLCTKIIKAKFCPNKYLWEAKFNFRISWFWRGFVNTINFINEHIGWVIGERYTCLGF